VGTVSLHILVKLVYLSLNGRRIPLRPDHCKVNDFPYRLANMLKILYSLAELHGASIEKVEEIRWEKTEQRGGFKKRIYLFNVIDK
jgi:hypothetical protein